MSMSSGRTAGILPSEPIYGLTWSIAEQFGAFKVLLHRSAVFSRLDQRKLDILTLSPDLDVAATTRRLHETGLLGDRVRLRNLWSELARLSDRRLVRAFGTDFQGLDEPDLLLPFRGERFSKRVSSEGTVLQVDYFRPDGTRLLSDRKDMKRIGTRGGRLLSLFSRKGKVVAAWSRASDLYFAWLDHVVGAGPAFVINDSQFVGSFLYKYRRPNICTVQVIHTSHLDHESTSTLGPLHEPALKLVKGLPSYDLVTPLTVRQADEIAQANLAGPSMIAIPNSRSLDTVGSLDHRDPADGIMLARLSYQKQVEHAIAAFNAVHAAGTAARLRVYGDGDERPELQRRIEAAEASAYIRLMEFSPYASRQFATASFSVLSSRYEGLPLVLIESMAAGCIPIAYDVRYGPSDIITHGVDGFIVPAGDIDALAAMIRHVATLPEKDLRELRQNARKRAEDFSDEAVTRAWGAALAEARDRKRPDLPPRYKAVVSNLVFKEDCLVIEGQLTDCEHLEEAAVFLSWAARRLPVYGRVPADVWAAADRHLKFEARWPLERAEFAAGDILNFHIEAQTPTGFTRVRLKAAAPAGAEQVPGMEPYTTKHDNLSLKVH
jgi:poly(glycerol-phosphate) alpha-glucosyltransferase